MTNHSAGVCFQKFFFSTLKLIRIKDDVFLRKKGLFTVTHHVNFYLRILSILRFRNVTKNVTLFCVLWTSESEAKTEGKTNRFPSGEFKQSKDIDINFQRNVIQYVLFGPAGLLSQKLEKPNEIKFWSKYDFAGIRFTDILHSRLFCTRRQF